MDYEQVKNLMPANRRWFRWTNCIYLQRFRGSIRIRYGYIYKRSRIVATWYPSGKFKFMAECYYPALRFKLNYFMPDGYEISSHRYYSFLTVPGKEEPMAFYIRSTDRFPNDGQALGKRWVVISKNGSSPKLGEALSSVRLRLKKADIGRDMPRRRGRYWLRKARGVYRKPCGKLYPNCKWRGLWPRPTTNWEGECGCVVYTKKAVSRDTVRTILEESNATVRTAKIQIYGIERFFNDAEARTINKEAGYELLELNTGPAERDERNRWSTQDINVRNIVLTALRMNCSTTGKVYVNTVPAGMPTVRAALDWMYDTSNYLEKVGHQT